MCLQTRKARTPLALGPTQEGSGAPAVRGSVAGGVGMARPRAAIGAPAKRRRVGPKVAQEAGSSAPAWLSLRGWLHGPEDLFDPPVIR